MLHLPKLATRGCSMHVPCVKRPTSQTTYQCGQLEVDLGRRELRVRGVTAPIGGRAFEIVEALVKALAGRSEAAW